MKTNHILSLLASLITGFTISVSSGASISVPVPSTITGDTIPTGIALKAGKTYVITTNVTIIPKNYNTLSVSDPLSVVRSTGGMPLATIDGLMVSNSLNAPPLSLNPVTLDLSLSYTPIETSSLYLRLLPAPAAITFNSITVEVTASMAPQVEVKTKKMLPSGKYQLKGNASGDETIAKVAVKMNGKTIKAKGTTSWSFTTRLKAGRNKFTVTAYDTTGQASQPKKLTVSVKD